MSVSAFPFLIYLIAAADVVDLAELLHEYRVHIIELDAELLLVLREVSSDEVLLRPDHTALRRHERVDAQQRVQVSHWK